MSKRHAAARACVWALGASIAACGGGIDSALEPRFVALHNTMAAMGMAQTGPISEGSLPQGGDARLATRLDAGDCYTIVALGDEAVADINVRVLDDGGTEVAHDSTHDRHAATQVCPTAAGDYQIVVHMASGQGAYSVTTWSGAARGGAGGGSAIAAAGGRGTCAEPIPVQVGRPVTGSTANGTGRLTGSCAGGGAPEQVYLLRLPNRSQVSVTLQSEFDGALYVMRECGEQQTEVACNDDAPDTTRSQVDATLEAGSYYIVVDGYDDGSGPFELIVSVSQAQSLAAVCGDAPVLAAGHPATGSTQGAADLFHATCAGGASSPDRVYRVDVPQRSRLRLRQQTDHDGALYMRRDCASADTELACNDDYAGDRQRSLLTATLDQGRYYAYVDGYGQGQSGNFTLTAELVPAAGGGASADTCQDAGTTTPGQRLAVDTFEARDDFAGSCGGRDGPDVVHRVEVRARSRLRATVGESEFSGALYLQRTCGGAGAEVACAPFQQMGQQTPGPTTLDTTVTPGTYFLVVDGTNADSFGSAQIDVQLEDLAATDRSCRGAPMLRPGHAVSGDTTSGADRFQATCAGGAQSNDAVYRLQLRRRSTVRLTLTAQYDAALHLRRNCTEASSEIACNDDSSDNRHSLIETTLDQGTYFVVVDGFRTGNVGQYTLEAAVSTP